MDTAIAAALGTLIASSPNLAIAVWVIIRQDRRVDKLLDSQKWLIEQLMALHPPQDDQNHMGTAPAPAPAPAPPAR